MIDPNSTNSTNPELTANGIGLIRFFRRLGIELVGFLRRRGVGVFLFFRPATAATEVELVGFFCRFRIYPYPPHIGNDDSCYCPTTEKF